VRVLVTSRISLDIPVENVFRVQPLLLPPEGVGCLREQAMGHEAVRLFVDRAEMLVPDFRLDDENWAAVVDICRRLDGIALAIEMVVPRLLVLNAE
jgi:predicted ATPase